MRPGARTDVGPPPRFITSEPRLGFGAWAVGGRSWGATGDAAERESAIRRALERGITFFDTAPTYGDGESERLLGRVLRAPRERGLGFLAYRPLASRLLAGTYGKPPEFPAGDHRRNIYWFRGQEFERRRCVIERLRPLAERLELPLPALALTWVLAQPGVGIVLAGARSARQVDENLSGARRLTPATLAEIDAIVADVFRPARATDAAMRQATTWGQRERFIVERLDGRTAYEAIAAAWTDRGDKPMIAAQVKVFVDQLADQGLVEADG